MATQQASDIPLWENFDWDIEYITYRFMRFQLGFSPEEIGYSIPEYQQFVERERAEKE